MPIYEYRCANCNERVEVLVRSSVTAPACPGCGQPLTDKLWSVPNMLMGQARRPEPHVCCGRGEDCDSAPCSEECECLRH